MPLEAKVMLAIGGVLVLGLAVYLVMIAGVLASVRRTLSSIIGGLEAVETRTRGLDQTLTSMNEDLEGTLEALEPLVGESQERGAETSG